MMMISIWDDGYGISVPQEYHTIKQSISKALAGIQRTETGRAMKSLTTTGWDYEHLIKTYQKAEKFAAKNMCP